MSKVLESLNKEQIEAVTHKQGPLLIIAGAGTGKTTVITRRIAWLLSEGLATTEEILALTFTDKAAQEMQERVDILVPYGYTDILISTFHAFGDRILRENALIVGLNPDFKVLTLPETIVFFREHLFEFNLSYYRPLSDPTRFIQALISIFSRAKDEDISPEEYQKFAQDLMLKSKEHPQDRALEEQAVQQMEVAYAYAKYQDLLNREGVVDFGNQFYLALQLLRQHPLVLRRYQEKFKYILVDEFQDTNFAQYQLAKVLAGELQNITVTGDDDQCIYRFRGAAYSNLLNFIRDFPAAKKVTITQNYRSNQEILDCAYRLIQFNNPERFEVKAGIDKRLIGLTSQGKTPEHLHFDTRSTEADSVCKIIKEKVSTGKFCYRDFAVLVRSNSDAEAFLQSMNMQQIPWQFSGNQGLYSREEVKLCIHFLRVTANPADSLSLYYLATSEIYSLSLSELSLCNHYAKRRNKALFTVLNEIGNISELADLSEETKNKIKNILEDIGKFLAISRSQTTGRLLYSFLSESGFLKKLTQNPSVENEAKIQNLAKFFNIVRDFELIAREDRVISFVNYLSLLIEAGDDPATVEADLDQDAVNVLTIHKAKGLEFRAVFMVSLVNGRFPWPHRRQQIELDDTLIKEALPSGDFHLQEERRLFYVGMTRAKEELYLTSAADYGGSRARRVSQFVLEAMGKETVSIDKKKAKAIEVIESFAPRQDSSEPGKLPSRAERLITLSYYQIDDYLTCPLKYKYVNILRVPIMEHHTVIYGRAMHDAVSRYFQQKKAGKKMTLDELLNIFEASFDPQGFLDESHQEERFRIGGQALARFFAAEEKHGTIPLSIEESFSFPFENNRVTGRFDRVDNEEGKVVITDFKTSEIATQKEADKKAKESLQLLLYALAYKSIHGNLPWRLALYFLESGLIGNAAVEEGALEEVRNKIRTVSLGLIRKDFKATPNYMACAYCAYSQICPSALIR